MQLMTRLRSVAGGLAMLGVAMGSAHAQEFAGRQVTVIVNFTPGGPTDLEGRIFAEHLPRFLKGTSSVVVRNTPGAGGLIGVNQLSEASDRDKYNIGFFTWNAMDQILKHPNLRVPFNDFKFIAGMQQTNLLYIRRDAPPGIAKPADVVKLQPFRAAALGGGADWATLRQSLALDLLGARFRTIPGYRGSREADVAMLQGDIHLVSNSLPGYHTFVKPNLVDKGLAIPLLQYGRGDGAERSPDLPDVPTFLELYRELHGANATPAGEKWEALQLLNKVVARMARVILMPPNAPDAAVAELRSAVERMAKDPQFNAQYEKATSTPAYFVLPADGQRVMVELKQVPPSMVAFFNQYVQSNLAR